jgi:hypothetical protein
MSYTDELDEEIRGAMNEAMDLFGTPVTYTRNSETPPLSLDEVPAIRGRTPFRVDTGYGIFEHVEMRDYLIDVAVLSPTFGKPEAADQIIEGLKIFEVSATGTEPPFRYVDPSQKQYRIHTKFAGYLAATTTGEATTTDISATTSGEAWTTGGGGTTGEAGTT